MSAVITNAITDGLLSIIVAYITMKSLCERVKGNPRFSRAIVAFFMTMFFLSVCASVSHYGSNQFSPGTSKLLWLFINAGIVYLNYCLIYSLRMPEMIRMFVMLMALMFSILFSYSLQFIYIALSFIFIYVMAYVYSEGLAKLGFLIVIISNILWVVIRKGINYELGYTLPIEYRYDNDLYHIILMCAVWLIYRAIKAGEWRHPVNHC